MSTRNTVVFTTCARSEPAAARTAAMLSKVTSVSAATSPVRLSPLAASMAPWPAQKMRCPATMAWLYGPMAFGALSVATTWNGIGMVFLHFQISPRLRSSECARNSTGELLVVLGQHAPQVEHDAIVHDPRDHRRIGPAGPADRPFRGRRRGARPPPT